MKKLLLFSCCVALAILAACQITIKNNRNEAKPENIEYLQPFNVNVQNFNNLQVQGCMNLKIIIDKKIEKPKLKIIPYKEKNPITFGNYKKYIELKKQKETLTIGNITKTKKLGRREFTINTMPQRAKLTLHCNDFKSIDVFAASNVSITGENQSDLEITIVDASNVLIKGQGENLTANLSGASTLNSINYKVDNIKITMSGSSNAKLFCTNDLDIKLMGLSSCIYYGNPQNVTSDIKDKSNLIKASQ